MSVVVKPGYKETPIGRIPDEWEVASFGSLLSTKPEYGANASAEEFGDDGYVRYIRITDIDEAGSLIASGKKYLPPDVANDYLLSDKDILIARTGNTVGKSLLYRSIMGKCAFAGYLIRFRVGNRLNCYFAAQYLHSDAYWAWVKGAIKVGAQPNINSQQYQSMMLPVPPLPEQQKIATILTTIDDMLNVIARQIAATQRLKQGLMQSLFSQRGRTQGTWPTMPLRDVADVRTGVAKGKKGLKDAVTLPYLRVANVQDGHIDLRDVKTIDVESSQVQRYALQAGDVLMTEGGDFDKLGRGDVWDGSIAPCLHQNHVFAVRPTPEKLDSHYLAALAASDYGRQYFLSCAKRTTNLASINSSQLKAFPVLLPPLAEQQRIVKIIEAVNAKIEVLKARQANYQRLKRGLMQKLLTGEWRVKIDKDALAA